jgi:class 3 adenylate cyclase/streptogramin lyase
MRALVAVEPSATATFLFTDIEGSTQLLKLHRGEYASILNDHHRLLRAAFDAHGGKEIDNQGDSFFVAFTRAKDAVLAAAASQRALAAHSWPGGASVRVRIGIHTGEAQLAVDRYIGLSVHRAARIAAVGHGGQVLVSPTTATLLEDEEENLPGIALKDLGEHRLKDISRPVRVYQLEIEGLPSAFPPLTVRDVPPRLSARKRVALIAAGLAVVGVTAVILALTLGDAAPPGVLPNSLVRLDPDKLQPASVVRIGDAPDLVVAAGGFVWITHHVLRTSGTGALRNAGDRTLTRVDPSTDEVVTVGGGLAPCGLTADPSGDVWVANCFGSPVQSSANVVRVDAKTLRFEATWPIPVRALFFRGLAYGGGSLWVSGPPRGNASPTITRIDPQTGTLRSIRVPYPATPLAWSEGYGDLWMSNFDEGTLTRLHTATGDLARVDIPATNPAFLLVSGDVVWVGDWRSPHVIRLNAVASHEPRDIPLPAHDATGGVWCVAAASERIWATTPRDTALWRIDSHTNDVRRIAMPYAPSCVAASANDVWITVRR